MNTICALCGSHAKLCESHIIPKFVSEYIKRTAIMPYLRTLGKPNLRRQDGFKQKLLCARCENVFSRYERSLSINFHRFIKNSQKAKDTDFEYDEDFYLCILSMVWRVVHTRKNDYIDTVFYDDITYTDKHLKDVLNHKKDTDIGNMYIVPLGDIMDISETPMGWNRFAKRSMSYQINYTESYCAVFIQIPYLLFVYNIHGLQETDFLNAEIFRIGGIISSGSIICNSEPVAYHIQSMLDGIVNNTISQEQNYRIRSDISKIPTEELMKKEGFVASMQDMLLSRR